MSDIESDGCEVSFKELMGAISQSMAKEMVQSGAAKGKPKGKGVKPKGGAGPKGGGKGTEKKRKAQEVWDSDLSSGDDDGYGHKGKQHKTKKAGSTTERKRGGGGGASSGRGGASHEMDDIFSDDDDDDDDALLSLDASPSINDGIDSIKTGDCPATPQSRRSPALLPNKLRVPSSRPKEVLDVPSCCVHQDALTMCATCILCAHADISNIWAQSESHKQASVDECKKNIEKIIKKEQEWLASVMTSGADQAEELAGIRAELSKLNQQSKKLTQDMRAVEKKTKEVPTLPFPLWPFQICPSSNACRAKIVWR
jgi:hypothetical protein